ncbi:MULTISPECIES: TetR/AcrR family transcriptional regulator [Pseudofrankia]|uniref:TetR/AcrR family transcriptional regulator n=1 Tax=Pseudofrankia TaxID=2994363 RepID=UPI000234C2BE|nr:MULTISPECIES: TetR/AcrR family transcriptional regulator [Pseudofrankia]OHV35242.1 TetR family transcriptional regulator [Pseudofrankia sp. EUN1h]
MSQQTATQSPEPTGPAGSLAHGPRSHDARLRLLLSAERLYAEHGLEAVSLRHICRAAGNGNNNAVQYHFGSERGLLEAIVSYRVPPLDQRRAALLEAARAGGDPLGVRELVDVLMRPLAEEARRPGSRYVGFLGRFASHPPERHPWWVGGAPAGPVGHEVSMAILDRLAAVPEPLRSLRLRHVVSLCLPALAGYGQSPSGGASDGGTDAHDDVVSGDAVPYGLYVTDLFDMAAAALTAPLSTGADSSQ